MIRESDAIKYLIAYGYLPERATSSVAKNGKKLVEAAKTFQRVAGVDQSGELDRRTLKAMEMPRCGVPDFVRRDGPAKWPARDWAANPIKYGFERFLPGITNAVQRELFAKAVEDWNVAVGLPLAREARKSERVDVVVSTGAGKRDNFDGPGRTLAWAYVAGDLMRFDEAEDWERDVSYQGVACHEWGHILGLDHSTIDAALMAPFANRKIISPKSPDDVEEGKKRYPGGGTIKPTPTTPAASFALTFDQDRFAARIAGGQIIFDAIRKSRKPR